MVNRKQIEELVRQKLTAALRTQVSGSSPLNFINEEKILASAKNAVLPISPRAIITPAARDIAEQMGIQFQTVSCDCVIPDVEQLSYQTLVLASDHAGFAMKEAIENELKNKGYSVLDVGTHTEASVDYPDFAYPVALLVGTGRCQRGIVVDGAGIGSAIVANKVPGVRAANCNNLFEARNSREHNNTNILTLGSRVIGSGLAMEIVKVWLETSFAAEKHQKRIDKILKIEEREFKCHS